MSTATYLIASKSFTQKNDKVCFYIQACGAPSSAAEYFMAMHCMRRRARGGYAEQFFSANSFVEFTDNHEVCPDTEYRYTLEKDGAFVVHQATFHKRKIWEVLYSGTWYDFVNEFLQLKGAGRFERFTVDAFYQLREIMTVAEAMQYLEKINAKYGEEQAKPEAERDSTWLGRLDESAAVLAGEIAQTLRPASRK